MADASAPASAAEARIAGARHFLAGRLAARQSAGLSGLQRLFERYVADWPGKEHLKDYVLGRLRERATLAVAIDELMQAVRLYPGEAAWQRFLALALEHDGQLDRALLVRQMIERLWPGTIENEAAVARLRERMGDDDAARVDLAETDDNALLALCRRLLVGAAAGGDGTDVDELRSVVRERIFSRPHAIGPRLAEGFLALARKDAAAARESFIVASFLAHQSRRVSQNSYFDKEYDPWALAYAEAFLLDQLSERGEFNPMAELSRVRLSLFHGDALRSKQAVFPALQVYEDAANRLIPPTTPSSYRIYRGHRIVLHRGHFYAVPGRVRSFSILDGVVVRGMRVDPHGVSQPPWWRRQLHSHLRPATRAELRALARRCFEFAQRIVRRIPPLQKLWRLFLAIARPLYYAARPLARKIYLRFYAVRGVLSDQDVVPLQQRLDRIGSPQTER